MVRGGWKSEKERYYLLWAFALLSVAMLIFAVAASYYWQELAIAQNGLVLCEQARGVTSEMVLGGKL